MGCCAYDRAAQAKVPATLLLMRGDAEAFGEQQNAGGEGGDAHHPRRQIEADEDIQADEDEVNSEDDMCHVDMRFAMADRLKALW